MKLGMGLRAILSMMTVTLAARVSAQPTITQQPTNESVLLGAPASFSVTASGTGTLSYVWQLQGTNTGALEETNIQGMATLSIPVTRHANLGSYDVVVTDAAGSVTSSVATLTLQGAGPIITLITNTPSYNVVKMQFTVAPNMGFQLLVAHDLTPPIQWYDGLGGATSGDATNYNWTWDNATNYTDFYPATYWEVDPF
jgi:methionine-rich copper-binding protein CopC